MTKSTTEPETDTHHTNTGILDGFIHRDEILHRFGIKRTSFYDQAKKTGLKPIALSTKYYRISDVKRTILAPRDCHEAPIPDYGRRTKRGRPSKTTGTR